MKTSRIPQNFREYFRISSFSATIAGVLLSLFLFYILTHYLEIKDDFIGVIGPPFFYDYSESYEKTIFYAFIFLTFASVLLLNFLANTKLNKSMTRKSTIIPHHFDLIKHLQISTKLTCFPFNLLVIIFAFGGLMLLKMFHNIGLFSLPDLLVILIVLELGVIIRHFIRTDLSIFEELNLIFISLFISILILKLFNVMFEIKLHLLFFFILLFYTSFLISNKTNKFDYTLLILISFPILIVPIIEYLRPLLSFLDLRGLSIHMTYKILFLITILYEVFICIYLFYKSKFQVMTKQNFGENIFYFVIFPLFLLMSCTIAIKMGHLDVFHLKTNSQVYALLEGKKLFIDVFAMKFMPIINTYLSFLLFGHSVASPYIFYSILNPLATLATYFLYLKAFENFTENKSRLFGFIAFLFAMTILRSTFNYAYIFVPIYFILMDRYFKMPSYRNLFLIAVGFGPLIFTVLDAGMSALLSTLVAIAIFGLITFSNMRKALSHLLLFCIFIIAEIFLVLLIITGSGNGIFSFIEICVINSRYLTFFYGLPIPSITSILSMPFPAMWIYTAYLSPFILAAGVIVAYKKIMDSSKIREVNPEVFSFIFVLLYSLLFFNRALGRSDATHVWAIAPYTALIVFFVIYLLRDNLYSKIKEIGNEEPCGKPQGIINHITTLPPKVTLWQATGNSQVKRIFMSLIFILLILMVVNPPHVISPLSFNYLKGDNSYYENDFLSMNNTIESKIGFKTRGYENEVMLAKDIQNNSNRYFWDFSTGIYYFLADRENPTRYFLPYAIYSPSQQKEVVMDLKNKKPDLILFMHDMWADRIDGIENYVRHYIIVEYLYNFYLPHHDVEGVIFLKPITDGYNNTNEDLMKQIVHPTDYGYLPSYYSPRTLHEITNISKIMHTKIKTQIKKNNGLIINLSSPINEFDFIMFKASSENPNKIIVYYGENGKFDTSESFSFNLINKKHEYLVNVGAMPGWKWSNTDINSLKIVPHESIGIDGMSFVKVDYFRKHKINCTENIFINIKTIPIYDFLINLDESALESPMIRGWFGAINGEYKPILFEHPPSSGKTFVSFENIIIPKNASLEFSIALDPQVWSPEKGDGVTFEIHIKRNETEKIIFSKYTDPKNNLEDRKWNDFEIDLKDYAKKKLTIIFTTSPGPNNDSTFDWAWWGEPMIVTQS